MSYIRGLYLLHTRVYRAYNPRQPSYGSVTVGYYAVSKHTADVWDTDENEELSGKLLLGVQKLIRKSHHIGEATMKKYSLRP